MARDECGFYDRIEADPLPDLLEASLGLYRAMLIKRRWPKAAAVRERLAEQSTTRVLIARGYAVTERRVRLYADENLRRVFGHRLSV